MDEKDNDAVMLGDDAEGEDGEISGLEEDSEILVAEEKAEIAKESGIVQGSKKPSERPSLKEKLEMMKGKAAELSAEREEAKTHMERGEYGTL